MSDEAALRYYAGDGNDPVPVVLDALRDSGRADENIGIDDLAGIDEFHALGRPATMALAIWRASSAAQRSSTWEPGWVARRAT